MVQTENSGKFPLVSFGKQLGLLSAKAIKWAIELAKTSEGDNVTEQTNPDMAFPIRPALDGWETT